MNPAATNGAGRRLFIGLMAPIDIRTQLIAYRTAWSWPMSAKPTPAANLHLTLAFLGNVERAAEASLLDELSGVKAAPFGLQLTTPGRFVPADIAFVAPEPSDALIALHRGVSEAIVRCGLRSEGDWHPHVTLARKAAAATPPSQRPAIDWHVTGFSLVLSSNGHYKPIETWGASKPEESDCV